MTAITDFLPQFASSLPEAHALLRSANLMVHSIVSGITLHGSRGPANHPRPDSDIDLSLIVTLPAYSEIDVALLQQVFTTTMDHWNSRMEPDLAVIFDTRSCGLKCFEQTQWDENFCTIGRVDCFGLYKKQKGFNGLVTDAGIQVKLMYPCLKIWERSQE